MLWLVMRISLDACPRLLNMGGGGGSQNCAYKKGQFLFWMYIQDYMHLKRIKISIDIVFRNWLVYINPWTTAAFSVCFQNPKGGSIVESFPYRRSAGYKFFNLNPQLTVFTTGSREYRFLSICLKTNIFLYIYPPLCPKKPNFPILPTTLMLI